jgi:chemotaxis protein MotB
MSAPKARRKRAHEEEHDNSERWAVSYADMMTVLVGLFIVMYAMGVTDHTKFTALKNSLAAGFGNGQPAVLDGSAGVMKDAGAVPSSPQNPGQAGPITPVSAAVAPVPVVPPDPNAADAAAAKQEASRLEEVEKQIEARLAAVGMADQVRFKIDERGLVIGLVSNDVFFDPASAALKPAAAAIVDAAGPVLSAIPDEISVEGHANTVPVSGRYATNWELSADRATQVLRRLVEVDGVAGQRISAVGFGDTHPLADAGADALAVNRRVDIVVHSPMSESVRNLLSAEVP